MRLKDRVRSATCRIGVLAALAPCFVAAQDSSPADSRRAPYAAAAVVGRVCELYEEARLAVDEKDWSSAAALIVEADALRTAELPQGAFEVAKRLSDVGFRYWSRKRFGEALPLFLAALPMYRSHFDGDSLWVARTSNNVAICLDGLGRAAEALQHHEASLATYRRLFPGDHADVAESMRVVAACMTTLGRHKDAWALCGESLAMRRRLADGDDPAVADALIAYANCCRKLDRIGDAFASYDEALAVSLRSRPHALGWHAEIAGSAADCLVSLGRAEEAIPRFESALATSRRLKDGDSRATAIAMKNLAYGLHALGRDEEALGVGEAASAMLRRLIDGDDVDVAATSRVVASILGGLGREAEALPHLEEALATYRRLRCGDAEGDAGCMNDVGVLYCSLGRIGDALPWFEAALEMKRRLLPEEHSDVARGLFNVAYCLMKVGRAERSLPLLVEASAMERRLRPVDDAATARNLNAVAVCLGELGREAEALPRYLEATERARSSAAGSRVDLSLILRNLSACYMALGRPDEAEAPAEEAVAVARKRRDPRLRVALHQAAVAALQNGDARRAETLLLEATELYEARRRDVLRLGDDDRGDYERALGGRADYEALALSRLRLGDRSGSLSATERGRCRAALDLLARSQCDPLTEARRRAALSGDRRTLRRIDDVVLRLEAAEGEVARRLRSESAAYARRGLDSATPSAAEAEPSDAAAAAREALQAAQGERARLIAEIVPLGRPATLEEARTLVRDRERMLVYVVGDDGSRVFVVRPAGEELAVFELRWPEGDAVTASGLTEAVEAYRAGLLEEGRRASVRGVEEEAAAPAAGKESRPNVSAATTWGRRLFAAVMPPDVWAEVRDVGRIELIPDGALHRLPFEALSIDGKAGPEARRHWLDVGPSITYGSSASVNLVARRLRDARRTSATEFAVMAVGDPGFGDERGAATRVTPPAAGALIVSTKEGSPGRAAGLLRGDVVVAYGGRLIADARELGAAENAAELAAEDVPPSARPTVVVRVWRPAGEVAISVAPGRLGVEAARDAPPAAWSRLIAGEDSLMARVERGAAPGLRGPLASLPGTRREAEAIRGTVEGLHDPLRGRLKVKLLLGADATETNVFDAAPTARILHFATHYLVEETEVASFSALALTAPLIPGREDDGYLRVHDLLERWRDRLPATDLVVLSACDSLGGKNVLDDGRFAMPTAFLFAGVPSVVASLWRVEDQATADLMTDFYGRLFDPTAAAPSRLERFTAARKALRAKRPEPYFWAPFVWMGDPR